MTTSDFPTPAQIEWNAEGQPFSLAFDDYYFSSDNGLEETRYIYLQHNRLAERFSALQHDETFVVGETGFGTGLSFLACWDLWRKQVSIHTPNLTEKTSPSGCITPKLHFISVEKHPLQYADFCRAQALWPELNDMPTALAEQYPAIAQPGFHRLKFDNGQVILTLIIGDATEGLQQLLRSDHPAYETPQRGVNAWFLDGFTPSKNPDMWQPELFANLQKLSAADATVATFSSARQVKEGLNQHGFRTQKASGFGPKREITYASLIAPHTCPESQDFPLHSFNAPHSAPWYCPPSAPPMPSKETKRPKHAIIVGAGIAGSHTARALAERHWRVTVLERHPEQACEGSGNPQGILYTKLSHRQETLSDFNLQALQYAQHFYDSYWQPTGERQPNALGEACGVLQLAYNDKVAQQHQKLVQAYGTQHLFTPLTADQASAAAGVTLTHSGLFFPRSGWLSPKHLCKALLDHPNIECHFETPVEHLHWDDKNAQWWLHTGSRQWSGATVVLSTAQDTKTLAPTCELPLKPIRGQVSYLRADANTSTLKTALCGDGYIAPSHQPQAHHQDSAENKQPPRQHCLGATFDPQQLDLVVTQQDHQKNLNSLLAQVPSLESSLQMEQLCGGRGALRCTTPDYLPLVGAVARVETLQKDYALLGKNARASIPLTPNYWPGLYVNVGHGSRGLAYTPLCAELLASELNGEPPPLDRTLRTALNPNRFWIRSLIRGKKLS